VKTTHFCTEEPGKKLKVSNDLRIAWNSCTARENVEKIERDYKSAYAGLQMQPSA
jgi:hypothetical protein